MKQILVKSLRIYQRWLSPMLPPRCRFQPTCSGYFIEALEKHGFFKGTLIGVKRLLKCHPLHPGGYDPCPEPCGFAKVSAKAYESASAKAPHNSRVPNESLDG